MDKYKLCPGCGCRNDPLAIECEQCGEDLSSVRILDAEAEEQQKAALEAPSVSRGKKKPTLVRICEECGTKNGPQARKCTACGEDISMILPVPDAPEAPGFVLASADGKVSFRVPEGEPVVVGRENELQDYLKNRLYVSRRHAELVSREGRLILRSFRSAVNGTHVNGTAVSPEAEVELREGDTVGLGGNDPKTQPEAAYFTVRTV